MKEVDNIIFNFKSDYNKVYIGDELRYEKVVKPKVYTEIKFGIYDFSKPYMITHTEGWGANIISQGLASDGRFHVIFDAEIKAIPDNAFYGLSGIYHIEIVNSDDSDLIGIKTIGNNAFYGCDNLEVLYLEKVTSAPVATENTFNGAQSDVYVLVYYRGEYYDYKDKWGKYTDALGWRYEYYDD